MEAALIEAMKSVPGLAFGGFVFYLWSGLLKSQIAEQRASREQHRVVLDAIVTAFKDSTVSLVAASDRRLAEIVGILRAVNSAEKGIRN